MAKFAEAYWTPTVCTPAWVGTHCVLPTPPAIGLEPPMGKETIPWVFKLNATLPPSGLRKLGWITAETVSSTPT